MFTLDRPPRYCVYVLRFWEEREQHPDRPAVWRFSLEDPRTGERRGFGDLERLVAFLRAEVMGAQLELSQEEDWHAFSDVPAYPLRHRGAWLAT